MALKIPPLQLELRNLKNNVDTLHRLLTYCLKDRPEQSIRVPKDFKTPPITDRIAVLVETDTEVTFGIKQ